MILHEWESGESPFSGSQLDRFNAYLTEVWISRSLYAELNEEDEETKEVRRKQHFFNFSYNGCITARNYVGVVQFEGKRIEIKPKILKGRPETVNWSQQLFFWLNYCERIRFPFTTAHLSRFDTDDLLELLIYIFAHYTEGLISSQPYLNYQLLTEETAYLRGRIAFDAYTSNNLVKGKWQHFTCQYQPFVYDNLFNRIVKSVARRLLSVSNNYFNQVKLNEIVYLLDEVADVDCMAVDCDKVKFNALYSDHQHVLDLCHMYLSRQMIDTSSADSNNFCFLIPMEKVFEDFVLSFLKAHFPRYDIRLQSETWLAKSNEQLVFKMRSDAYIPDLIIIDAKYKLRIKTDDAKAGVSQSDMYQMLAYGVKRDCNQVLLLYPYHAQSNNKTMTFSVDAKMLNKTICIKAANIDICFNRIEEASASVKKQLEALGFVGAEEGPKPLPPRC